MSPDETTDRTEAAGFPGEPTGGSPEARGAHRRPDTTGVAGGPVDEDGAADAPDTSELGDASARSVPSFAPESRGGPSESSLSQAADEAERALQQAARDAEQAVRAAHTDGTQAVEKGFAEARAETERAFEEAAARHDRLN